MNVPVMIAVHAAQQQAAERALLDTFRLADATAPDRAQSLSRLGITHGDAFERLERAGVLRNEGRDRYYLDEAAVIARRSSGSKTSPARLITVVALVVVMLVALAVLMANR